MYCSYLASLRNGLQHLSALKSLTTISCAELASLPEGLGFFAALETIETHGCPKLMELPTWVENLDSLRSLTIPDCYNIISSLCGKVSIFSVHSNSGPELEKRCEMSKGADWQRIYHTPHIYVGSSASQQRRDTASSSSTS